MVQYDNGYSNSAVEKGLVSLGDSLCACNGLALYGRLVRLVRSNSVLCSGEDAGVIHLTIPAKANFSQNFFSAH